MWGYLGNPKPSKLDALLVEAICILAAAVIFSIQAGVWVFLALAGWRLFNCNKEML